MMDVSPSSGAVNFHSTRYRPWSGGSSVDQVNTTSSFCSARAIAVGNGDDSAPDYRYLVVPLRALASA